MKKRHFSFKEEIMFWFIRTFKTRRCRKPHKDWVYSYVISTDERSDNNAE